MRYPSRDLIKAWIVRPDRSGSICKRKHALIMHPAKLEHTLNPAFPVQSWASITCGAMCRPAFAK